MTRQPVRRVILCAATALGLSLFALSATAGTAAADPEESDLGGSLSQAIDDYLDAKEVLDAAEDRQDEIKDDIKKSKDRVKELKVEVNDFAAAAYRSGGTSSTSALLSAPSPEAALDGLSVVYYLGDESAAKIDELVGAQDDLKAEEQELDEEIEAADDALKDLRDSRDAAADALAGNGGDSAVGPSPGDFPEAEAAPRNSDGSFSGEGCTVTDPTTSGCLTPRTEHALHQAQIAGFTRYVSCHRGGGFGEHPLGRACDFSVEPGGFGGVAGGEAKTYGDNLAAWFVENAEALGVMYVIWYDQYWDPAQEWTSYTGGWGDPSSDHTNHVHLSMRLARAPVSFSGAVFLAGSPSFKTP
ncbi:MAG: coiled-coil domain-containing protein [Stackebrandtia sp.]